MAYIEFEETHDLSPSHANLKFQAEAVLKIFALFGFVVALGLFLLSKKYVFPATTPQQATVKQAFGEIMFTIPYKNTLYENFGYVQEPKVTLPIKTLNGYVDKTFLLDSGAVVSAMPFEAAQEMGIDLVRAKRITLQGFSGVPTFAYLDKMTIQIGGKDFDFPAVFTESNTTTYILGRKGFFDDFSIQFDHKKRVIQITTKE